MRADQIAAHGRVSSTSGVSIASMGRISWIVSLGTLIRSAIHAFMEGAYPYIKVFRAVAEMDRVFTGDARME